ASCGSPSAPTGGGWKPRVRERSPPARARIGMSMRSCAAASIARPPPPPRAPPSSTRTSGAATTTTERGDVMLTHPTLEKLKALRLDAFAAAWQAQQQDPALAAVPFDEPLGLPVEAEGLARADTPAQTRTPPA